MESREAAARAAPPHDGRTTLSREESAVARPPVPLGDVFGSVRFDGCVLDPRTSDNENGDALLGDEDDALSGDDDEELYDTGGSEDEDDALSGDEDEALSSDIEFSDGDDEPLEVGDGKAAGSNDDLILEPVNFLGVPARFASVESTAGYMLIRAGDAGQDGGGEITVHYRYVRFSREQSGGSGVKFYSGAMVHPVRFLIHSRAATDDLASSLRLAGAALADMVYPRSFKAQLQALWSNLVAAAPVRVPPHATRVEVAVSVGILRRGDRTPERMACMRAALAAKALEADAWPFVRNVGTVLHLPTPVSVEENKDDGARPSKRRRFAVEEECAICYEVLERGLAAWPRCSHVFHSECLEQLLVRGDQRCPLCRSELAAEPRLESSTTG